MYFFCHLFFFLNLFYLCHILFHFDDMVQPPNNGVTTLIYLTLFETFQIYSEIWNLHVFVSRIDSRYILKIIPKIGGRLKRVLKGVIA